MTAGPEEIALAVAALRAGRLVAFPTETVYGLGAPAFDERAVARVFALKGRPAGNPLIVHVTGPAMARRVVARWTPEADRLARAFWPGPLSIVLPRSPALPGVVTGGGSNVAVRCPDHPTALALLDAVDQPLVGPSANLSGSVSPTCAEHVHDVFPGDEVFVLDGGACRAGIESTVVELSTAEGAPRARVLRPGPISAEQISRVLGAPVDVATPPPQSDAPLPSPGLLDRHYAPRAAAIRFDRSRWNDVLAAVSARRAVFLAITTREIPAPHAVIAMPPDAEPYAQRLYAALREADAARPDLIAVELPPDPPAGGPEAWRAVLDRVRRATDPLGAARPRVDAGGA